MTNWEVFQTATDETVLKGETKTSSYIDAYNDAANALLTLVPESFDSLPEDDKYWLTKTFTVPMMVDFVIGYTIHTW